MPATRQERLAIRGTLAGLAATALFLLAFSGFSLWQGSALGSRTDDTQTGELRILEIEAGNWTTSIAESGSQGDGIPGFEKEIDIENWQISAGDTLNYRTWALVLVSGTRLVGELSVDPNSYTILDPDMTGQITLSLDSANQFVYYSPRPQRVPVDVSVRFSDAISADDSQTVTEVIDLSRLTLQIDQVTSPTPAQAP